MAWPRNLPPAPDPREQRLAAWLQGLAQAAGHRDRHQLLPSYCLGLLLPGERKSVEPMASRLEPNHVQRAHQSLHPVVAVAPWNDQVLLQTVRNYVLPRMTSRAPIPAWVVDDTGFPKKGKLSVGVARQYCGQIGKQDNCQVAVSLSVSTDSVSLLIAYQLYLPETWSEAPELRRSREMTYPGSPKVDHQSGPDSAISAREQTSLGADIAVWERAGRVRRRGAMERL